MRRRGQTKTLRMRLRPPHRRALLALTLLASGGIFGSDYPLSTAQAETNKPPEPSIPPTMNSTTQYAIGNAQVSELAYMLAAHDIQEKVRGHEAPEPRSTTDRQPLLVHYGISHDKTVMGLSNVEGTALLGDNLPLIYRTGGYVGRSVMDKGGNLSRTSDLVEDFRLSLIHRTATGFGLSISYKITNPSRDPKGKIERGVLIGQYLEQTLYVPACRTPNGCQTHLRLGNTGADLSFDISNDGDKSSAPSAAATP